MVFEDFQASSIGEAITRLADSSPINYSFELKILDGSGFYLDRLDLCQHIALKNHPLTVIFSAAWFEIVDGDGDGVSTRPPVYSPSAMHKFSRDQYSNHVKDIIIVLSVFLQKLPLHVCNIWRLFFDKAFQMLPIIRDNIGLGPWFSISTLISSSLRKNRYRKMSLTIFTDVHRPLYSCSLVEISILLLSWLTGCARCILNLKSNSICRLMLNLFSSLLG